MEGKDQVRQRVRDVKDNIFFIKARVLHEKVTIEYLGVVEDATGNITFKTIPIPDRVKVY